MTTVHIPSAGPARIGLVLTILAAAAAGWRPSTCNGAGAGEAQEAVYPAFNKFCQQNFGVANEPLTCKLAGEKLQVLPGGDWRHVSENSACIAWETSLPAKTHVEYGPTAQYGRQTPEPERFFYLHVHYLGGLMVDTTYHYRIVSVDEKGDRVAGEDQTFTTRRIAGAIHVPGDLGKPPYTLTRGGVYVVTEDVVSPSTVFNLNAKDVVLDLNGHTITYNQKRGARDESATAAGYGYNACVGEHGIRGGYAARGTAKVFNGIVVQGEGGDGPGCQPVIMEGVEAAGLTLIYHGTQTTGFHGAVKDVHHNVVLDHGTLVTNRHQGVDAFYGGIARLHHNLVKRCRQRGVFASSNAEFFNNEIYVDSWATNSYDIMCYKTTAGHLHHNRLFGTGYHAIGVGAVSHSADIRVHDNLIHQAATAPNKRWAEYGEGSGVNGFRITWGGTNIVCHDNVFVLTARDGGTARGLWVCAEPTITGVVFRNNVIKVVAENEKSAGRAAVCVDGDGKEDDAPMLFQDNLVISNLCHVRLGEAYGVGCNARFVGNTFVKTGQRPDYTTLHCGYWTRASCGHWFIDTAFQQGAGYDQFRFDGQAKRNFSVGWTATIKTAPGAKVTVKDKAGQEVFAGQADSQGTIRTTLLQYTRTPEGKIDRTPHTITAEMSGRTVSRSVTADKTQQVGLPGR